MHYSGNAVHHVGRGRKPQDVGTAGVGVCFGIDDQATGSRLLDVGQHFNPVPAALVVGSAGIPLQQGVGHVGGAALLGPGETAIAGTRLVGGHGFERGFIVPEVLLASAFGAQTAPALLRGCFGGQFRDQAAHVLLFVGNLVVAQA